MKQETALKPPLKTNNILRVVFDADLRASHDGLSALAKTLGVNTDRLRIGEFIVFINTKRSQIKLYAACNTIAHFRVPGGRRMEMGVIRLIPRFFNGSEFKYDAALEELITSNWRKKKT